jgi:poly-beta-hydroxyalkanoate depolymerase
MIAKKNGKKIIIEIKTFAGRSFIKELQQALGQYELYFDMLELTELDYELYMAISEFVYQDFFLQKGTQMIVQRHKIKLLVVNIEREEIVKWV